MSGPGQFKPGQSGNPAGRPKGSRNRLSQKFLGELCADYEEEGLAALKQLRATDPATYFRIIAGLLPKQQAEQVNPFAELSDDELNELDRWIDALRARQENGPEGEGQADAGQ